MENSKKRNALQTAVIGSKLLLICAIVAAVVAFVYVLTLDRYEANIQGTKNQAIGEIFGSDAIECKQISKADATEVIYEVLENGSLIGYCVESKAPGFGGDIELMVGYYANCMIKGVSIVALSETPGLGAKVNDANYLNQYRYQVGELALGDQVDAISGATISSKAVLQAINAATAALEDQLGMNGGQAQ